MSDTAPDDGYRGEAELIDGDQVFTVRVELAGHFDPISGRYSWYGRVAAGDVVAGLIANGARDLALRTPHGTVTTRLTDVDPWGRPRVAGFGAAPFPVLEPPGDLPTQRAG